MKTSLTPREYLRLEKSIDGYIRKYASLRKRLRNVDRETYAAGMSCFESEGALVRWLCQPAWGLGWKIPLEVIGTEKGRREVTRILGAMDHGVFL